MAQWSRCTRMAAHRSRASSPGSGQAQTASTPAAVSSASDLSTGWAEGAAALPSTVRQSLYRLTEFPLSPTGHAVRLRHRRAAGAPSVLDVLLHPLIDLRPGGVQPRR